MYQEGTLEQLTDYNGWLALARASALGLPLPTAIIPTSETSGPALLIWGFKPIS